MPSWNHHSHCLLVTLILPEIVLKYNVFQLSRCHKTINLRLSHFHHNSSSIHHATTSYFYHISHVQHNTTVRDDNELHTDRFWLWEWFYTRRIQTGPKRPCTAETGPRSTQGQHTVVAMAPVACMEIILSRQRWLPRKPLSTCSSQFRSHSPRTPKYCRPQQSQRVRKVKSTSINLHCTHTYPNAAAPPWKLSQQ